jgi:pimeloyl-ACP methyl ester carboxylesterase
VPKRLRPRRIGRMLGVLAGLLAVALCMAWCPGLAIAPAALASVHGSVPPTKVPLCVNNVDISGVSPPPLDAIPIKFYRIRGSVSPATLPGDIICANEITAPYPYRAWAFVYWVKQADGKFVQVSATIKINANVLAPPGGRPVLSYAHPTMMGITDGCAPSHNTPTVAYGPPLTDFLDLGFAVVGTDYIGLGMPGVHPYLVGKSEGAAVLAAARAAKNFEPAQASGQVIIYGHSQGGHAALFAGWQAQDVSYFAPGVDVRGVIASAPPTFLGEIAPRVIRDPTDPLSVTFFILAAGSWVQVYAPLRYPDALTKEGVAQADAASDPKSKDCYSPRISGVIQPNPTGALPVAWTDLLGINTAPVGLLPASIPVLVVQAADDNVVPYAVTLEAAQAMCLSGVPVTFYRIDAGGHRADIPGHAAPLDANSVVANGAAGGQLVHKAVLSWAQQVIGGGSVENSCGSLPPD